MDCVNHSGTAATAYCQNCGKALCANCVRSAAGGQVLCEPCWTARHGFQQPFAAPQPGSPSPAAAAVLGLIPGVGAMYNGQFVKGLVHVAIFAALVTMAGRYDIFGFFIAAWIFYQVFEAYHTAKARREGLPLPDPLGLNEVGHWLGMGGRPPSAGQPGPAAGAASFGQPGPAAGGYPPPYAEQYRNPYQTPYSYPYPPPSAGFPPVPPVPPLHWRRKEPIAAIILIALGVLFLLGQLNLFSGRLFAFGWPVLLIALGGWLLVRRLQDSGAHASADVGVDAGAQPEAQPGVKWEAPARENSHTDSEGGSQ